MFHTYIDWTNDGRPFYVGMGDDARISRKLGRNKRHTYVARKHGQRREIVLSTDDRQATIDLEIKLIAEHHTFKDDPAYNGIGCNYTKGGEGCPCNEETKQKMRDTIRAQYANGREPWNKGRRDLRPRTEEEKQRLRDANLGRPPTKGFTGQRHSDEALARMRKPHRCSKCGQPGHQKRTCSF